MECISNIHSKLTLLIPNTQQPSNALSFDTEQQPMTTATAHIEKQPMGTTSTIAEQQPMGTTATIAEQQPMGTMDNNLSPGAMSAVPVSSQQTMSRKRTWSGRGSESSDATNEQHDLISNSASPEIIVSNSNNKNKYLTFIYSMG